MDKKDLELVGILNNIKNRYLIKISNNWAFFYVEENVKISSPVSDYYFKANDLSINILIRLKWINFGYFFFNSIIETLNDASYTVDEYDDDVEVYFKDKREKLFIVDDVIIDDINTYIELLEGDYNEEYYDENAIVRLKVKLSPREFILLQNSLIPKMSQMSPI